MRKIALAMIVAMLFVGGELATAQKTNSREGKVICCHDGKCDTEHTLLECAKLGGKVVKDCKECK